MKEVIVYATTVKLTGLACNRAWSDGCIVARSVMDDMDTLNELVRTYDTVYVEYLDEFGRGYDDLSPILEHLRANNVTLRLRDWELDPMYNGYDCVIKSLRDTRDYAEVRVGKLISLGMVDAHERNYRTRKGRPKRRLPMNDICRLRRQGFGLCTIAKRLNIPYGTLYGRREDIELNIEMGKGKE